MITLKSKVNVQITAQGRKRITPVDNSSAMSEVVLRPKLQRITRLMALAIRFDEMIRTNEANDLVELARRAKVSQPRMSQIMALNLLAPEIQQSLLDLPPLKAGKPFLHEKRLRSLTSIIDWDEQRAEWLRIKAMVDEV